MSSDPLGDAELRETMARIAGDFYVDGLRMAGYRGPLTGWDDTWPLENRGWVYERIDYEMSTLSPATTPAE